MNPMYKWIGGKKHLTPKLRQHLNRWLMTQRGASNDFAFDYVEPFLGGGAFALKLMLGEQGGCVIDVALGRGRFVTLKPRFFLSDINSELINVWTSVRDWPVVVERMLRTMQDAYNSAGNSGYREHYFLDIRHFFNKGRDGDRAAQACRFLFLNKTCFNGLYRVNSKGLLNSPWGKVEKVSFDFENLKAVGARLREGDVEVACQDWNTAIQFHLSPRRPTFIYCDPPYDVAEDKLGFTAYDKSGFGRRDQAVLSVRAGDLARSGCGVMLSNADTPYIRSLYPATHGWKLHEVSRPGTVSSKTGGRERVGELLITSF